MTVLTKRGRIYRLVGKWDNEMVFAPEDGVDDQVVLYTFDEIKKLIKSGRLFEIQKNQNTYPS